MHLPSILSSVAGGAMQWALPRLSVKHPWSFDVGTHIFPLTCEIRHCPCIVDTEVISYTIQPYQWAPNPGYSCTIRIRPFRSDLAVLTKPNHRVAVCLSAAQMSRWGRKLCVQYSSHQITARQVEAKMSLCWSTTQWRYRGKYGLKHSYPGRLNPEKVILY